MGSSHSVTAYEGGQNKIKRIANVLKKKTMIFIDFVRAERYAGRVVKVGVGVAKALSHVCKSLPLNNTASHASFFSNTPWLWQPLIN